MSEVGALRVREVAVRPGLGCVESSLGSTEMRRCVRGAEMPRSPATQFVKFVTSGESSALDPLSESSDDLSR